MLLLVIRTKYQRIAVDHYHKFSSLQHRHISFFAHRIKDIKLLKTGLIGDLAIKCPINILIWAKWRLEK
jgi:hypothetical protein